MGGKLDYSRTIVLLGCYLLPSVISAQDLHGPLADWGPGTFLDQRNDLDANGNPYHSLLVGFIHPGESVHDSILAAHASLAINHHCTRFVWVFGQCFGGGMFDDLAALGGVQSMVSATHFFQLANYPLNPAAGGLGFDFVDAYLSAIGEGTNTARDMAVLAADLDPFGLNPIPPFRAEAIGAEHPQYFAFPGALGNLLKLTTREAARQRGKGIAIVWSGQPNMVDRTQVNEILNTLVRIGFSRTQIWVFYGSGVLGPGVFANHRPPAVPADNSIHLLAATRTNLTGLFTSMFLSGGKAPPFVFFIANDHGANTNPAYGGGAAQPREGDGGGPDDDARSNDGTFGSGLNPTFVPPAGTDDCNANGIPDGCDIEASTSPDCNDNGVPDDCDIRFGTLPDQDGNGIPDPCQVPAISEWGLVIMILLFLCAMQIRFSPQSEPSTPAAQGGSPRRRDMTRGGP